MIHIVRHKAEFGFFITIIFLGLFIIIANSTILFLALVKHKGVERKYNFYKQRFSNQLNHYNELEEKREIMIETTHDFKNHLYCINFLYKQKRYDDLNQYMQKLYDLLNPSEIVDTGNPVIDAFLSEKIRLAQSKDIDIKWDLYLTNNINIDHLDICTVLGNSLDNAIEACDRITDKKKDRLIMLIIKYREPYLLIAIKNSYCEDNPDKQTRTNVKEDPVLLHGYGKRCMKRVVDKYNGLVSTHTNDGIYNLVITLSIT